MIEGALEIIHGVRGTLMHPLLLPGAQGPDLLGYIVIAYEDREDLFDILFVRGSRVEEYACLHGELKTLLTEGVVRVALEACRLNCRVSLYALTGEDYVLFLSTFQCAPSLNVVVDGLTRRQVVLLTSGLRCDNGILEIVRPAAPFPRIVLLRFHSQEELVEQAGQVREGRLLAYNLELNAVVADRFRAEWRRPAPGEPAGESPAPSGPESPPGAQNPAGLAAELPPALPPSPEEEKRVRAPLPADVRLLVAAFGQALEEFERAGRDIAGSRIKRNLPRIVDEVLPGAGSFSERATSVTDTLKVLNVIRQCVSQATIVGRWMLRRSARDIVKELYQTHQKLLYRCGVETEVRDCYRMLAGEPAGADGAL